MTTKTKIKLHPYWDTAAGKAIIALEGGYRAMMEHVEVMAAKMNRMEAALGIIAAPMRPDGTYNRDRAVCQKLAEEALK